MGKTMKKSSIIWGDKKSVTVANFSAAHMSDLEKTVRGMIGPRAAFNRSGAQKAVDQAKNNPKMKNAYVKVGLIDGALVLRAKEKKFFGDIEVDATLVTDYKGKCNAFMQEMLDDFANEFQKQKSELEKLRSEKERQERLKEVMGRKDKSGETLRDRILNAAKTAQKLGIGNYAQAQLKLKGLTAMDPVYHGEVLDKHKNRYARYMGPLKAIWDKEINGQISFSEWLDAVEANDTSVKGVAEARDLTNKEIGGDNKIVQPGGLAGGRVVYLDDESRKPYLATASKGKLTGPSVKNGSLIFVIGSDNKLYVGSKNRAAPGKREAFNHSSFFSGAPVKSAGTLTVAGGAVTAINDQSGHYAPTRSMVMQAVRKIGGGDTDWLSQVSVTVGGKTAKGNLFMDDGNQTESIEVWGKYSVGRISREEAEAYLRGGSDGNWLVREGTGNQVVFSARKGSTFTHQLVRLIGGAGLDRKKLLTKDKLPEPVKAPPQEPKNPPPQSQPVPKLSRTVSSGSSESESEDNWVPPSGPTKPVSGGNMMGEINRLNKKTRVSARRPEPTKNKKTSTTSTSPKTTTRPNESTESESETGQSKGLEPKQLETLTSSPAYHGTIDRSTAEKRLGIKPGAWLLRMGSGKQPVYSEITKEGKFNHVQIDDLTKFQGVSRVMTSRATEAVRP